MGLSIALRISKITKSSGPDFAQILLKLYESVWDRWKIGQRFREKNFRQIFVKKNVVVINGKHERSNCESWNFAQRPIRPFSSKDFKTTIFTVTPFMVQISPKYFHSREPQNHMTFNSSQLFETHPSTSLLKVHLTPKFLLPQFN